MQKKIKLLILDVDGTLTDGHIYMSQTGESFKAFDVKDGYGIKHLKQAAHVPTAIITGRESHIVEKRSEELGIELIFQGIPDKKVVVKDLINKLNLQLEEIAYMGDDLNDLEVIKMVGIAGCPSDAVQEVISVCGYVCKHSGGDGAVREFIDWLIRNDFIINSN